MTKPNAASRQPLMAALAAQQKTIDSQASFMDAMRHEIIVLKSQLAHLADVAGLGQHMAAIRKKADIENPAQPVANPGSQPAAGSTEEALAPDTMDNVQNPGMTPGSVNNLAADTTTTPNEPGETLPTAPFNDLQDVSAPVSGTETQLPLNQTRIETDVRVGDPMAPDVAFPWTISKSRTMACIRLARLRIEAGIAGGDDLSLGEIIAADQHLSDEAITTEINTLSQIKQVAARQPRPAGLVPRAASVSRVSPSLSSEAGVGNADVTDDDAESLFD